MMEAESLPGGPFPSLGLAGPALEGVVGLLLSERRAAEGGAVLGCPLPGHGLCQSSPFGVNATWLRCPPS